MDKKTDKGYNPDIVKASDFIVWVDGEISRCNKDLKLLMKTSMSDDLVRKAVHIKTTEYYRMALKHAREFVVKNKKPISNV